MPTSHINPLFAQATGETPANAPAVLMFARLLNDLQHLLEKEVQPEAQSLAFAAWSRFADDAGMLASLPTRNRGGQLLCRAAAVLRRATTAQTVAELEVQLARLGRHLQPSAPSNVRAMLKEAHACLAHMIALAHINDPAKGSLPRAA